MKMIFKIAVVFLFITSSAFAEEFPSAHDVSGIKEITLALHKAASVEKGEIFNLDAVRKLMPEDAYSILIRKQEDGSTIHNMRFIRDWGNNPRNTEPRTRGSLEKVVDMKINRNDEFANVWAQYEIRHEQAGPVMARGITNLQVYNDGTRWWVLGWQDEKLKE